MFRRKKKDAGADNKYPPGSFLWHVRNPKARRDVAKRFEAREKMTIPADATPEELWEIVELMLEDDFFIWHVLERDGPRTVAPLIRALADRRFAQWKEPPDWNGLSSPIEHVASLLERHAPLDAVQPAMALLSNPDEDVRKAAAKLLAVIATPSALKALTTLLRNDPPLRSSVASGLVEAVNNGRTDGAAVVSEMLRAINPIDIDETDGDDHDYLIECLLAIGDVRAIELVTNPARLHSAAPDVSTRLNLIRKARLRVDAAPLLAIIRDRLAGDLKYPAGRDIDNALRLLAQTHNDSLPRLIDQLAGHPAPQIRHGVGEAIMIQAGVDDVEELYVAFGRSQRAGPLRSAFLIWVLNGEVRNGGFTQYFYNSSGDDWPQALAMLKTIGAIHSATIVEDAVAAFGRNPPSTDGAKREKQLAKFGEKQLKALESLDSKWYKDEDHRDILLARYVAAHAADFQSIDA